MKPHFTKHKIGKINLLLLFRKGGHNNNDKCICGFILVVWYIALDIYMQYSSPWFFVSKL